MSEKYYIQRFKEKFYITNIYFFFSTYQVLKFRIIIYLFNKYINSSDNFLFQSLEKYFGLDFFVMFWIPTYKSFLINISYN